LPLMLKTRPTLPESAANARCITRNMGHRPHNCLTGRNTVT
jgi:hypothetical protein